MSTTANWSYTNTATVRPFLHFDLSTQEAVYGPEYEIACTWVAKGEQVRDNNCLLYTSDAADEAR
ncbi:hypothetical protein FA108_32280, partial [Pseudomonas aeruginosa]|nr:hypothetical protein [Pseudomonas aeruginosa]